MKQLVTIISKLLLIETVLLSSIVLVQAQFDDATCTTQLESFIYRSANALCADIASGEVCVGNPTVTPIYADGVDGSQIPLQLGGSKTVISNLAGFSTSELVLEESELGIMVVSIPQEDPEASPVLAIFLGGSSVEFIAEDMEGDGTENPVFTKLHVEETSTQSNDCPNALTTGFLLVGTGTVIINDEYYIIDGMAHINGVEVDMFEGQLIIRNIGEASAPDAASDSYSVELAFVETFYNSLLNPVGELFAPSDTTLELPLFSVPAEAQSATSHDLQLDSETPVILLEVKELDDGTIWYHTPTGWVQEPDSGLNITIKESSIDIVPATTQSTITVVEDVTFSETPATEYP